MQLYIKKIRVYPQGEVNWRGGIYLGMSMTNSTFQNEGTLREVLKKITDHTELYSVLVGDYLNRYNEQIFGGLSEKEAISSAIKKGKVLVDFFESNAEQYPGKYQLIYTKEITDLNKAEAKLKRFNDLYATSERFHILMEYTIDVFLRRQADIKISLQKARNLCLAYLLEELVIFEILAEKGFKVNIYPGNQLPIMKEIVTGNLKGVSDILETIQVIEIKLRPHL